MSTSGLITRNLIDTLLLPGLKLVMMDNNVQPLQYQHVYVTKKSDKAQEVHVEMQALPQSSVKAEGQALTPQIMQSLFTTASAAVTIGVSFVMTTESVEDNLYGQEFPMGALSIKNSIQSYENTFAMVNFNRGWDSTNPIGDGQPYFSTAHPLGTGMTQANTFSDPVSLNETTLESAQVLVKTTKSAAGLILGNIPERLFVTPQYSFTADRLLSSKYQPETANNAINPTNRGNLISKGWLENFYLSTPYNWFLLTNNEGLIHYDRRELKTNVTTDPQTENLICSATKRMSFVVVNFRSAVGVRGPVL